MSKRWIDLILASCLLLCAFPVLLICALLIKLDSRGPVFFRQLRVGRHFHPFALIKLRTMEDRTRGCMITLGADARITGVGRWLRDWKLDELPQLWNVLRGEMSIVGPRPVIPEIVSQYHGAYESLLTIRPGLTDPASLKYFRECELLGAVSDPMAYFQEVVTPDKLRLSAEYIQSATLWSDLWLMLQTAGTVARSILETTGEWMRSKAVVAVAIKAAQNDTDGVLR